MSCAYDKYSKLLRWTAVVVNGPPAFVQGGIFGVYPNDQAPPLVFQIAVLAALLLITQCHSVSAKYTTGLLFLSP